MTEMKVTTNRVPRPLIDGSELTDKEKAEFDFLKPDEFEYEKFFRYRGDVYYLGNFMRYDMEVAGIRWDGAQSDSVWTGTLVKICSDLENVIVGVYRC